MDEEYLEGLWIEYFTKPRQVYQGIIVTDDYDDDDFFTLLL
jgi:hypothetical protein